MDLVELVNNAVGFMEDRATLDQVESALDAIREKYNSEFYPFHVIQSGGGWQFLTKPPFHATIAQLNGQKFMRKLSTAALEVLSIIAYKQPITKGEIEQIRGVNCDYAVQKLLEKELIIITGRKEDAPGQPLIYATSRSFMDYFGINSPADLPMLGDIAREEVVMPTAVGQAQPVDTDLEAGEGSSQFAINDQGELVPVQDKASSQEEAPAPEVATSVEDETLTNEAPTDVAEASDTEPPLQEEKREDEDADNGPTDEEDKTV